MNVLVTGANGFIGRQLVPQLLSAGHRVRILARSAPLDATQCETVIGVLPDAALCRALCSGMDAVVHAAGHAHVNAGVALLREQNLVTTLELASAAKAQGLRKFVYLSSSKARYPAHSAYARFKAEAEAGLRSLHTAGVFEVVCLRPALVYGRGMRGNLRSLLRVLSRRRLPVFVSSTNPLGMISVQDLCRAIIAGLATDALPDRVWEVADGVNYTLESMVSDVRGFLGFGRPALQLPRPLFHGLALCAELAAPLLRSGLSLSTYRSLFEEVYEYDAGYSQHTGFSPQDTFRSRLPELLED